MTPEVGLLASTQFDWQSFRSTVSAALDLRVDRILNALPIEFSNDAKILLNIAAYYGYDISNPLDILRNCPPLFLEYLYYQFFIACDQETWEELHLTNVLTSIRRKTPSGDLILIAGSLAAWHTTIVTNLNKKENLSTNGRILMGKLMLVLERQGLRSVFESHVKKNQPDGTFLLE